MKTTGQKLKGKVLFHRGGGFDKGGRMHLDGSHGLAVINLFAAIGAFVEFQVFDRIFLSLVFPMPIAPHLLYMIAATGWTS